MYFFVPANEPNSSRLWRTGSDPVVAWIKEKYDETHENFRFSQIRANPEPGVECIYNVTADTKETRETVEIGYLFSFE